MLSIHLKNISFFSYHGLYEFERVDGNTFIVNATINYQPSGRIEDIKQTIDYASVYQLINSRMAVPTPLLETIVMDVANDILSTYPLAEEVYISLTKEKPPIANFEGSVGVSYSLKRQENNI